GPTAHRHAFRPRAHHRRHRLRSARNRLPADGRARERKDCGLRGPFPVRIEPSRSPEVWFAEAARVGLGVELELTALGAALDLPEEMPCRAFLALNVSAPTLCSSAARGRASRSVGAPGG